MIRIDIQTINNEKKFLTYHWQNSLDNNEEDTLSLLHSIKIALDHKNIKLYDIKALYFDHNPKLIYKND